MKCFVVILAVIALVSAIEEKKPAEEKKPEEKRGLIFPLPDLSSEGDLMLLGSFAFDHVEELHKAKIEEEFDRMLLSSGRLYLRHVSKFFDDNADFKIPPTLCQDSRRLNNVSRWRIEIPKVAPVEAPIVQHDQPLPKDKVEEPRANITHENETIANTTLAPTTIKPTEKPASNATEKPVEPVKPAEEKSCDARRREFYRDMGANFARLLLKEWRNETLSADESNYVTRLVSDEAVHYGAVGIYCKQGEDIKEIKKRLAVLLEEK